MRDFHLVSCFISSVFLTWGSCSGAGHRGLRWGAVLHFVKVKRRPRVPYRSSSSQNPWPAAGLICFSQCFLWSLPELWRLKVYLFSWHPLFVCRSHISCTVLYCSPLRAKSRSFPNQISHSLICVRRFSSAPPPPHLRTSASPAPGCLYLNRPISSLRKSTRILNPLWGKSRSVLL